MTMSPSPSANFTSRGRASACARNHSMLATTAWAVLDSVAHTHGPTRDVVDEWRDFGPRHGGRTMPLFASDFFLALAQVAIGFVAFSTIAVVLREVVRAPFDAYQTLLVRFVIECGLAATFYALLPVLLALIGFAAPVLWRLSSGALGVFGVLAPFHYIRRRRRAKPGPMPTRAVWITVVTALVDMALWLNALTPTLRW